MRDSYSYLKDPRALAEIRKHKWLESQKLGREVGFATAAVEWIKNFGPQWKKVHVKEDENRALFLERREYRRFKLDCPIELIKQNYFVPAHANDLSYFELSCSTREYLPTGEEIYVTLMCGQSRENVLQCKGTVKRTLSLASRHYRLFVQFDEQSQRKVEQWEYLRVA